MKIYFTVQAFLNFTLNSTEFFVVKLGGVSDSNVGSFVVSCLNATKASRVVWYQGSMGRIDTWDNRYNWNYKYKLVLITNLKCILINKASIIS